MKLTNTSIETLGSGSTTGTGGAGAVDGVAGGNSRAAAAKVGGSDSVSLSSASQLVNLAKASAAPDRAAQVASVASLVRSGQYSTDNASLSHAVVEGHIQ
jgi:anti-sigma28 factor (negative regulator of flagellin synthesis)